MRSPIHLKEHILSMSAEMMLEDLGKDPRNPNPQQYQEVIHRRITEGRSFVGMMNNQIVFLLDLGTNCKRGCQIGGTYVPPQHRGKGIATLGMRFWTSRLIQKYGLVTLHVNEANQAAVRYYKTVGFTPSSAYRLAILDIPGYV